MASSVKKVRFVKCPKCLKLLIEVSDVPVYKCGGCGAILRAKRCDDNGGFASSASLDSSANNPPDIGTLSNSEQIILREQMIPRPKELETGLEQTGPPNLQLSGLNASNNSQEKLESSGHRETGIMERDTMNFIAQIQSVEVTQAKVEECLDEELEKSPKISQQSCHSLSLSNGMQEAVESIVCSVGLEEDMKDIRLRSSANRSRSAHVDGVEKFRADSLNYQNDRLKYTSDIAGGVDLEKNDSSSKRDNCAQQRVTSLDSEAFHSVRSWMEHEDNDNSRSFSKDSIFYDSFKHHNNATSTKFRYLKHDQVDLLRLVDELQDQLTGLFDQTVNMKGRSHVGGTQREVLQHLVYNYKSKMQATGSLNSNFCNHPPRAGPYNMNRTCPYCVCLNCYHGLCKACSNNICCHLSKDPCTFCHTARTADCETQKLHQEEKRKPAKHHCRPVSGGSPFVICYKCLKLLQLPADFLVSKKVMHKLQCGACSEVLTFSFRARPHKIPQTPSEVQHPPSEASDSHSYDHFHGDPVSYTDDGHPLDKSCSMGVKAAKLHGSSDCSEALGNRVRASSLHRLMGYSSASERIYPSVNAE